MNEASLCIFGEVLFDIFPDGNRVLGGAPFNVAWHLHAFGQGPRLISRLGSDDGARDIRQAMDAWGMDAGLVQTDNQHPTGRVVVSIEDDEPSYDIVPDAAYDFISVPELRNAACELLYHGSLALRNPVSRSAFEHLKQNRPATVFVDVNLREPWWDRNEVLAWVEDANWVKLNEAELDELHGSNDGSLVSRARAFLKAHALTTLVVTRGAQGALAVTADDEVIEAAPAASLGIVDTVGAGDAFASVLILGVLRGWSLQRTMERAQAFAGMVVSQQGATISDPDFYQRLCESWSLARKSH
ncbi:MAG: carbohydrate kinase [Pseudomonadota bacterium]